MIIEVQITHLITVLMFFVGINVGVTKLVLGKYIKKIEDQESRIRGLEKDILLDREISDALEQINMSLIDLRKEIRSARTSTRDIVENSNE